MHKFILTDQMREGWGGNTPIEQPLIEWARQFQNKNTDAVDAGAHVGDWTVDMAAHSSLVYAYEPFQLNYGLLLANTADFHNVISYDYVLGADEGITRLYIAEKDSGKTSSTFTHEHEDVKNVRYNPRVPLDKFHISRLGLLKIDVEGMEIDVIKGAEKTLQRCGMPRIIFECWSYPWFAPKKEELFAYVEKLGYTIIPINWPDMYLAEWRG